MFPYTCKVITHSDFPSVTESRFQIAPNSVYLIALKACAIESVFLIGNMSEAIKDR